VIVEARGNLAGLDVSLAATRIAELAKQLEAAALERRAVPRITDAEASFSLTDAYDVQWALRRRRLAAGRTLTGLKMGLTSRAKMQQMGVETPIYGFLLDEYCVPADSEVPVAGLIHPRVEAEIALVTNKALQGPGCTMERALAAVEFAVPALEIIDSRYQNFKFDLSSVVADNASAARYVVGSHSYPIEDLDLPTLGVVLEKNGEVAASGSGAAVLGHPGLSLAMLANLLAEREQYIPAETFVMTGGITEAVTACAGDRFVARYQLLGSLSVSFV
jgi:2-oxo-3-hexenedioate decarboxylase